MAKTFNTNIDLNKNSVVNGKIDPQTSLPTTNLYEGRIITHKGQVYIYYNGAWLSKSELAEKAENLVGRPEVYHEEFTFQPSANTDSVQDGVALVKSIRGNTVIANQLLRFTGVVVSGTADFSSDKIRVESNSEECNLLIHHINFKKDHKYFFSISYYFYSNTTQDKVVRLYFKNSDLSFGFYNIPFLTPNILSKYTTILTAFGDSISPFLHIGYNEPIGNGNYVDLYNYAIIDLTQMFGMGNEPATVEEFERLFPNLPTEYNTGSLLNLNANSIKSVGFNAFNEEYAKVLGGQTYYLNGEYTFLGFKENENSEVVAFNLPIDRLYTPQTNGYIVATGSDICINLSHSGYRNGEYELYKESIVKLPITTYFLDGMKSVGSVRDEIVLVGGAKYKAIQRIASRAYQAGDEDLAGVITDKSKTYYILETPFQQIIDNHILIEYEVSDFGTEEIISIEPTTPIIADIQYGFNAVDVIRNNLFNIKELFDLLSTKLSLTGGTMSGAIDMSRNPFIKAGFEYVEELPTKDNFIGRQVFFNNKPYYYTGKEWITFPENSGGEPTGDFWNLVEANPEVIASSYLPADDSVGVFEHLFNQGNLKKSRDIVVDFSRYQGGRTFRDFFSVYIDEVYSVYPYEWAYEQDTDLRFTRFKVLLTNNPYTYPIAIMVPDSPIIKTNFNEVMTGIEYPNEEQARFFYLYPNSSVMVDFELQQHENSDYPILVNITAVSSFGTATYDSQRCSTEENQNAINNYLTANNIPYTTNKATGEILYNAQDLLASICSKLK